MFGFLAYLAKGFDTLKKIRPIKAVFEINGETIEDDFILYLLIDLLLLKCNCGNCKAEA